MSEVVVQLETPLSSLQQAEDPIAFAGTLGVSLQPMHPGSGDGDLARWYHCYAQEGPEARDLAAALRDGPGIAAAFVKPAAEAP